MANHAGRKIKWKKIGTGTHRFPDGTEIRPGGIFEAHPDEVPLAFRDVIVPVSVDELLSLTEPRVDPAQSAYAIRSRGPDRWDVVDGLGKVVNEAAMSRAEAEALVRTLSS